jgi:preprotein translocase subunit SecD
MNFAALIEDNSGGLSSIRAAMLAWLAALGATWVFVAIATRSLPDIPAGVLTFTGMLVGGKVVQRFGEKPEEPAIKSFTI